MERNLNGKKNDQALGLIGMSIFPDLRFHLDGEDSPVKAQEKLNNVFGIKNEIRAFQLENELLTLNPITFLLLNITYPNLRPLTSLRRL